MKVGDLCIKKEGAHFDTPSSFTIPYGTFLKFLRPGSRLPVAAVKQLLDIGRTVQYLAAQPGEGKQAAVTVLLQAAAAHFQLFSQFAVRIEVLARHRR